MSFKTALFSFVLAALTSRVLASPLPRHITARGTSISGAPSFNNWPVQSLHGFDDFYGVDNFDGFNNKQNVISGHNVVCHSETVTIIQQRLAVIQEVAKKVITELSCDVETQTVVWEQFYASMGNFGRDIRHQSGGRKIGYDNEIISHWSNIINSDGSCSTSDFGFSGSSIGSNLICPSGFNWDDNSSPNSVGLAYYSSEKAIYQSYHFGGISESCDSGEVVSVHDNSGYNYGGSHEIQTYDNNYNYDTFTIEHNDYNTYSHENNYNTYENNYNTYGNSYNTYSYDVNTYNTEYNTYNTYATDVYSSYVSIETSADYNGYDSSPTYSSYVAEVTSSVWESAPSEESATVSASASVSDSAPSASASA